MEIRDFEPRYAAAFKGLNEAWIKTHYAMEPKDEELLNDPEGKIIAKGGMIPFAGGGWRAGRMLRHGPHG